MITSPRRDESITDKSGMASLRLAEYLETNADDLNRIVPIVDKLVSNSDQYATSNVTVSRTINADTATAAQIADVLGTLIADLKSSGAI